MNIIKAIYTIFCLCFISCSSSGFDKLTDNDQDFEKQEVILAVASQMESRTSINPDDMASTQWDISDGIYIWATSDGGSTYPVNGTEFKIKYFSDTYSQAVFTGLIDPLDPASNYTYFGVYPKPTSVSGTKVTFALPAVQSGEYCGELDILAANPTVGGALSMENSDGFALSFGHMTHAIRINIPKGRNLMGGGIKRIDVSFPEPVVGDFSFDASNVNAVGELASGSSVVSLDLDNILYEGDDYVWIFVAPTYLSGSMSFVAYNDIGYVSRSVAVAVDKVLEAGRITPITLTIPTVFDETTINLSIDDNYLGEDVENVIFTAPSGATFLDGKSSVTLPYNDANVYSVVYSYVNYGSLFREGSIGVSFESESAIVAAESLDLSAVVDGESNSFRRDVPYLMSNDFSDLPSDFESYTDPGTSSAGQKKVTLTQYGLTGWTADRCGGVANTSVRTMCRLEGGMWVQSLYEGRLDTAPLSAIKDGKSVKLKVTYNYSGSKNEYSGSKEGTAKFTHGYTVESGEISGDDEIEYQIGSTMNTGDSGSYTSIKSEGGFSTTELCGKSTRISWRVTVSRSSEFAQGGNYWLYIDDVTVQIIK